ncbi:MAG: hypothetical protein U0Z44_19585 [Kouleothrix sp.]
MNGQGRASAARHTPVATPLSDRNGAPARCAGGHRAWFEGGTPMQALTWDAVRIPIP